VLQHTYRTFWFGLALSALDGIAMDLEMVWVATMLHDLNLEHPTPGRCFAVVGAERAERFALDRDVDPARARRIAAEITGHITLGAADDLASPGGFISAGALADVAGPRLDQLDPAWVAEILQRHPRLEFKRHLLACWKAEGKAVPHGRARWLTRWASFPMLVRLAPYDE
jgi:hypothetical protein